ncbi:MAG: hypothetical protein ABI614_15155 [Planctomycetota bacterium]
MAGRGHIPSIIRWLNHFKSASVSNGLVSSLDIRLTVKLARAKPAHELQGLYLFGDDVPARKYIHFDRDK